MSVFEQPANYRQSIRGSASEPCSSCHVQGWSGAVSHRREIDGLRAIAVLAVVFYHFGIPGFGGGFVGVDIFFVISGFLIGGILWRELEREGTLSLTMFYTRRILRIAPAYVAMAAVAGLVGYVVLLPFEFREFGKSLIASIAYLSNVHFFREAGYFDAAAESKILLHTWSLSVEEQFYILLPMLMLLFRKHRRVLKALLGLIFAASLASCVLVTPISYTATFYLLPFRIWELLAGVLLAIHTSERGESGRYASALSFAGLAILCLSIVFIVPGPTFPGLQAVFPVLGAVLIILNGRRQNTVNALLSTRLAVFFGLISYSLYLWHWPVLTLAQYYRDAPFTGPFEITALLAAVVALSWASWRFIERPFREMPKKLPLRVFAGAAVSSVVLLGAGTIAYIRDGMPERFAAPIRIHINASADFLQDWSRCHTPKDGPFQGVDICPVGPEGAPTYVIWGDSHVRAFEEGLARLADESDRPGLLIWHAGCPPLFDIRKQESATTPAQDADCTRANAQIRTALTQLPDVKKLLLIGRWAYYAEGGGVGRDAINTIRLEAASDSQDDTADQSQLFAQAVTSTIDELASRFKVYVLQQVPEVPQYDSREVARLLAHAVGASQAGLDASFVVSKSDLMNRTARSEHPFKALAAAGKITWLSSWDRLCTNDRCSVLHDGKSYYFDNNHITNSAALGLRDLFDPFMEETPQAVAQARTQ